MVTSLNTKLDLRKNDVVSYVNFTTIRRFMPGLGHFCITHSNLNMSLE